MSTSTQVIPVPLSGLGAAVDVSSMVGPKTVILTGTFRGAYVLYGSHDGARFAPLFQFDAGGVEGLRRTLDLALAWVAIKSLAEDASGVTASISGESVPGDLTFTVLGTLQPGAGGPQPAVDLGTSDYQSGLNFIAAGGLQGKLVVEGSSDGVRWNPIGQYSVDPSGPGLLSTPTPEFAPLATEDLVRYARLNVLGTVVSTVVVTAGGSKSGGGGGASETLSQAYQVGSSPADQTLVLEDARGGKLVIVSASATFTDDTALEVLTYSGLGAALRRTGGMMLGPANVLIGTNGSFPSVSPTSTDNVAIGDGVSAPGSGSVVVGVGSSSGALSSFNVVVGASASVGDSAAYYNSVVVGSFAHVTGSSAVAVGYQAGSVVNGVGIGTYANATSQSVAIGYYSGNLNPSSVAIGDQCSSDLNSVVVGRVSTSYGSSSVVVGNGCHAGIAYYLSVVSGVALGTTCSVNADNGVAVGTNAIAEGVRDVVVGFNATSTAGSLGGNVVVGETASSGSLTYVMSSSNSVVVGTSASSYGPSGVAVGHNARAGNGGVVVGPSAANSNFDVLLGSRLTSPVNGSGFAAGTVDSVSDAGSGSVTIHSSDIPAGLLAGQQVVVANTTIYDGTYTVANVTAGTFDVVATWSDSATGTYVVRAADGYNVYVGTNIHGAAGTGNADTRQVAVGTDVVVLGSRVVALGSGATIFGDANIAIGDGAKAGDVSAMTMPIRNIAIGQDAMVDSGTGSVVVGYFATSSNNGVVGVGHDSKPIGEFAVCVGASAQAVAGGIAIGATAGFGTAYSNQRAVATALCAIAVGSAGGDNSSGPNLQPAHATGQFAIAVGTGSVAPSQYSVAVGYAANVDGSGAIALGSVASATAQDAIAEGSSAAASAASAIAVGSTSKAFAAKVVAVGDSAWGFGDSSVAVGTTNTASDNFDVLVGSRLVTPVNGSGLASGTVDSVSDAGGGSVTIHSSDIPAGMAAGQVVVISNTTTYDGTYTAANVTAGTFDIVHVWSVSAVGTYVVRAADGYNVYVGVNIVGAVGAGNADTHQVAIGTDQIVLGRSVVLIGASVHSTAGITSSVVVGVGASVAHSFSLVFGADADSTANNQVVFGTSDSPGTAAIHQLVVRGYNGGAVNTLDVVDNPVDSGNPNLAVSGLTVVVTQNTVVTNKTLKAAPFASLPGGALVAYLE
jgi:hypothetical protein